MRQGYNIQFYCRASKVTKNGYAPIEVAININGVRKFVNLPFKCLPSDFNKKKQPEEIVNYITAMRKRINEILVEMVNAGEALTTQSLINYVKNGGFKSYTVEDLFNEYYGILEKRIGSTLSKKVYDKYVFVRNLFFTIVDKNKECSNITQSDILLYKATCESKYAVNTTCGYLKKLKAVITFAQDNGKLKMNPFQGIKIDRGTPTLEYLSAKELDLIRNAPLYNFSLENIRNAFLFECYSGMSYSDIKELKPEDIQESNGTLFVKKFRVKTGTEFVAVLLPGVENLIDFEEVIDSQGVKKRIVKNFRFKVKSNQRSNAYLKVIQSLANINKNLHTHLARHTYCHFLLNVYGVRAETAARAMGHTTSKTTLKYYANVSADTTINEIREKIGA